MGYNLSFGDFAVIPVPEERIASTTARWLGDVPDDAPLNSSSVRGPRISLGYGQWSAFAKETGIEAAFSKHGWYVHEDAYDWYEPDGTECEPFGSIVGEPSTPYRYHEGLLARHPGTHALAEDHYRFFSSALQGYLERCDLSSYEEAEGMVIENRETAPDECWNILRLNWLVYWTRRCLDQCEYPTFGNS